MHEKSIGKIGQLHRADRVARPRLLTNLTCYLPVPLPFNLRDIALEVPTRRGVMAPSSEKSPLYIFQKLSGPLVRKAVASTTGHCGNVPARYAWRTFSLNLIE